MKTIKPTESELEILKILWERGDCTVRQVHEQFASDKDVGYTTILKFMQIMHTKGLVARDESNKTHVYRAAVSRDVAEQQLVNKFIKDLFDGSATRLVMQALGNHRASNSELAKIRQLLNDLENKK
ncbi:MULTISPECIES: BlaI/MecI/CopY family transcriptional regulator [Olivibacter]|jgi:predicted transcriptional regulator|uniref:Transcriptional repressor, CopY family n=3 Tax=Sphingobacteriaceae TaxID=84566 RepID=F4CE40_SPHS2|nr:MULTISPECIES: BlaI/MecI/CopY family transcriptional regulator [Olivibacter]MCL4637477.1 BlaI/MecI/CopY family transcriptional regulator [Olivibacter sp. UJ_SKK_5.1]MDM8177390.1 BlaI/MecI/CopY family transcriptional regulator [Olivibacter sp. 47]MDX3912106.1 BlaI/MecI/CopY family transcriptional regulator [Pseudosphingobacterium sp.]QEK99833.1 BlaI/MecI/CopY family transcriptional regulator [Olivibacter sp. LS-1]